LVEDEDVECVITNRDIAPSLKVTKFVENINGGDAVISDFALTVNGTVHTSGNLIATPQSNTNYRCQPSIWQKMRMLNVL